jgi:glutamate racemase
MTGIFDSGVGGMISLWRLRELCPREDIIYLADADNAPYGTKDKEEIQRLVRNNIDRLASLGAERVLVACCTASCVLPTLEERYQLLSRSIIPPSADRAAMASVNGRIGVISTDATAKFNAFAEEIKRKREGASVYTIPLGRLVSLIERGCRDGHMTEECHSLLERVSWQLLSRGVDTLILGCTHFSHVKGTIEQITGINVISPAHIGAEMIAREVGDDGTGRTVYV